MQIYVVKPGDTLYSIGRTLSLAPGFLARYNGLQEPYRLAVGQSLLALYPEKAVTVRAGGYAFVHCGLGRDGCAVFIPDESEPVRLRPDLSGAGPRDAAGAEPDAQRVRRWVRVSVCAGIRPARYPCRLPVR